MRKVESQLQQWPHRVAELCRTAIPTNPSRKFLDDVMNSIEENNWEGITFQDKPGDAPTSGYMVSRPGREKAIPMEELSGESIRDYLAEGDPGDSYGGWHENDEDGDLWYHDTPVNIHDSYDAAGAAAAWKQKAIFDNDKHDAHGKPLDSAYVYTGPLVNSGPASALGWTQASRRRRSQ